MVSASRGSKAAGTRCPDCGAAIDEDAVICSACDHILDSSFLDEADGDLEDEDTDPRMALPPAIDEEESTDPGLKNPAVVDARLAAVVEPEDEGRTVTAAADAMDYDRPTMAGSLDEHDDDRPTMAGSLEDDEDDHRTLAGSMDDEESVPPRPSFGPSAGRPPPPPVPPDVPSAPAPVPEPPKADITHSVTVARPVPEPPPDRRPLRCSDPESEVSSGDSKEVVTDTGPRRVPPRRHDSGSSSGTTDDGGGDGSVLLDDYEKVFRDAWRSFLSVSAADKVLCCGLVLGFLAVLLPWRVLVFDNGLSSIRSGLSVGGWLNVLLAGASGTILYLRNWRGMRERMQLMLAQVGIAGAGLGWSAIAFLIGVRVAATSPNFGEATAGPSYGVFVSMLAWGIVCAGAALTLMDGLVSSRQSGRGPPARR